MINKQEILDFAWKLSLDPNIVEKDYVLGWLLAGISSHSDLKSKWKRYQTQLNPHKNKEGYPCPSRIGYIVDVKY